MRSTIEPTQKASSLLLLATPLIGLQHFHSFTTPISVSKAARHLELRLGAGALSPVVLILAPAAERCQQTHGFNSGNCGHG